MKLYFATSNTHKLEEVRGILAHFEVEQIEIDLPELQGEPEQIALEKAVIACAKVGKPVFVEDTSLIFNAWNGLPGPYIKHFLDKLGVDGLYRMLEPYPDKSAFAQTCLAYCEPGQEPRVFAGWVNGTIVPPAGREGFRFDKIFMPQGYDKRFSEMPLETKNSISHRRRAVEKFNEWLLGGKK